MAANLVASLTVPLVAAENATLEQMASELRFLLSEFEIEDRLQFILAAKGYKTMATFGVVAEDRAGIRTWVTHEIINAAEAGISAADATMARLIATKMVAAWIAANQRVIEDIRKAADGRLLRLPAVLARPVLISLRQRYEQDHGRTNDSVYPSASMLEHRLQEVEEGSFTAQPLTEVISVEESCDEVVNFTETGSSVSIRKTNKAIHQPRTTEELRKRFKTLAISFVLAAYKHSSRLWIKTATMRNFDDYTEFLLSDQCAGFALDQEGISAAASWTTVLNYDLAMRKCMARSILFEGKDFVTAMQEAMTDLVVRTRYFIAPTAILAGASGRSTPARALADVPNGSAPQTTNKGRTLPNPQSKTQIKKAAAKAKGKGKGSKTKGKMPVVRTPDGRLVCSYFQAVEGCQKEGCSYVHVCAICFGTHPKHLHPR